MIEAIREAVIYMIHTHDGARVGMNCLWHGTPKVCYLVYRTGYFSLKSLRLDFRPRSSQIF